MELVPFAPTVRRIAQGGQLDVCLEEDTAVSLPVVVRREDALYDAVFLYRRPTEGGETGPRPHTWALLDVRDGRVCQLCRCDLVDFMPPGSPPVGGELPMELPGLGFGKKRDALEDKLYAAYEEIRAFAFEESLTRPQAAAVSTYKDMFAKLTYPAHYPYYHGLSPAFFHWLRMPLPPAASAGAAHSPGDAQRDGYQLLILENLQSLVRQFGEKIATDAHKERLFDEMHRELQDYRNGLLDALTLGLERDVILVIDGIAKTLETFRGEAGGCERCARLLRLLAGVETDLCDLLYRHGLEPYSVEGVDVARQKIVQTVPTVDPARDKTVAARPGRGWEKAGRVVRPERVAVYVYQPVEGDGAKGEEPT